MVPNDPDLRAARSAKEMQARGGRANHAHRRRQMGTRDGGSAPRAVADVSGGQLGKRSRIPCERAACSGKTRLLLGCLSRTLQPNARDVQSGGESIYPSTPPRECRGWGGPVRKPLRTPSAAGERLDDRLESVRAVARRQCRGLRAPQPVQPCVPGELRHRRQPQPCAAQQHHHCIAPDSLPHETEAVALASEAAVARDRTCSHGRGSTAP